MLVVLILHAISLITLTGRFWINFSPEKMGIPFCEALLSNVALLYFARTFYVFIVPSGGLTLASSQPPTQSLTPSRSVPMGRGEKIGRTTVRKLGYRDTHSFIDRKGEKTPRETKEIAHHILQADLHPVSLQTTTPLEAQIPLLPQFLLLSTLSYCME